MTIKEHYELYNAIKVNRSVMKKFSVLNPRKTIVKYLKQNTNDIIKNINYSFFETDEKYLLSVSSTKEANFIHINSAYTKEFSKVLFSATFEYENYLAIYGTFAVLLNESFQIENLDDSRLLKITREKLTEYTQHIYFCDDFRLNLQEYIIDDFALKMLYRYGYDFLFNIFFALNTKRISYEQVTSIFEKESFVGSLLDDLYYSFIPAIEKEKIKLNEI